MMFSPLQPSLFVTPDGSVYRYGIQKLKEHHTARGYLAVSFKNEKYLAHRLIASAYCDGYAADKQVNHINGVKTDNRAENLEWVSAQDNMRHAIRTGLMSQRGSLNRTAKLTEDGVLMIHKALSLGEKISVLSKVYGVSEAAIYLVKAGKNWSHLHPLNADKKAINEDT